MIKTSKSIAKSVVFVTIMMIVFKFFGFIKQSFIASYFGATAETDIYLVALGFVLGSAL